MSLHAALSAAGTGLHAALHGYDLKNAQEHACGGANHSPGAHDERQEVGRADAQDEQVRRQLRFRQNQVAPDKVRMHIRVSLLLHALSSMAACSTVPLVVFRACIRGGSAPW